MRAFLALILLLVGLSGPATAADDGPIHFALTDHTGRPVTEADFAGRFLLLSFGYTHCPDVCPTGLQTMAAAVDKAGPEGERVQIAFVSVDPQRDTAEHLAGYVPLFHPQLTGLTGSEEAVADFARRMRVKYAKVQVRAEDPNSYTVDHTASFFLIGPDGRQLDRLPHRISAENLAEKLVQRVRERS